MSVLKMNYQVVHAIAGRCRLRIPRLAIDLEFASKLSGLIESLNFVISVRINTAASSVVVTYRDQISTAAVEEELITCVKRARSGDLAELAPETEPIDRPQLNDPKDLGLPFLSLGLALLAAPLELPPLLVGGAIALAALPWFNRATESIVTNRHLNIDFLDSLWMGIHTLNGQFIAPALKTSLVETRRTLRGTNADLRECEARELLDTVAQRVLVERDGATRQLPVAQLQPGDRIFVYPGDVIPVDGTVIDGTALIDTTNLTGECDAIAVGKGEDVYAACLVIKGTLCILVNRIGKHTRIGLVAQLMQSVPVYDTRLSVQQEDLVKHAVVPTICLGATIFALTGVYSAAIAPFQLDFGSGIQISMPTTILGALTYAARHGIYIRSGGVLENLAEIDTVVIDDIATLAHDSLNLEKSSAIATLASQGINIYVLSNDYQQIAAPVFDKLGINFNHSHSEASAEIKLDVVRALQAQGKTVAFVGDYVNDAAPLAQADVSIIFAPKDEVALAADVVLLNNDLQQLTQAIDIAKQAMEIVYQNAATIVIPNMIVVIGGVFFGLNPIVNVITNNCSAAIAEFLNSRTPFDSNGVAKRSLNTALKPSTATSFKDTNVFNPVNQESPSFCG